jgi:hypothetical protein
VGALDLYYERHGHGVPLVLLHGAMGTIESCFAVSWPNSRDAFRYSRLSCRATVTRARSLDLRISRMSRDDSGDGGASRDWSDSGPSQGAYFAEEVDRDFDTVAIPIRRPYRRVHQTRGAPTGDHGIDVLTSAERSLLRVARIRHYAEQLEKTKHVGLISLLGDPAIRHAADGDACEHHTPARRRQPCEWPRMRPADREARGHSILLRKQILDGDHQVWKFCVEQAHHVADPAEPGARPGLAV